MANELKHDSVGTELTQAEWEAVDAHVLNSQAVGDLIYAETTASLQRLGIGSAGQFLGISGGKPVWTSTVATDKTLNDNASLLFGSAGAESDLSSNGSNTLWDFKNGGFYTQFSASGGFQYTAGALAFQEATTISGTGDLDLTSAGAMEINTASGLMISNAGSAPGPDNSKGIHVWEASAGVVTAHADSMAVFEDVGNTYITILSSANQISALLLGNATSATAASVAYNDSNDTMSLAVPAGSDITLGDDVVEVTVSGSGYVSVANLLFVNETANAGMTMGLTINQGANDDEILALKSSDVSHAMTAVTEADTFGVMQKQSATGGGLRVLGFRDADSTATAALVLSARLGEAADTTDTASSFGVLVSQAAVTDGSTGITGLAAAGNLWALQDNATTRILVKGNGDIHATNISAGAGDMDAVALDAEDDIGLVRAYERFQHNDVGVIMSAWDEAVQANEEDLRRVGVLTGDFYSLQRMDSLLGGAIWQLHGQLRETQERLEQTETKLMALEAA